MKYTVSDRLNGLFFIPNSLFLLLCVRPFCDLLYLCVISVLFPFDRIKIPLHASSVWAENYCAEVWISRFLRNNLLHSFLTQNDKLCYILIYTILTYNAENLYLFIQCKLQDSIISVSRTLNSILVKLLNILLLILWRSTLPCKDIFTSILNYQNYSVGYNAASQDSKVYMSEGDVKLPFNYRQNSLDDSINNARTFTSYGATRCIACNCRSRLLNKENTFLCHGNHGEQCTDANTGLTGLAFALTVHAVLEGLAIGLQTKITEVWY